MRNLTGGVLAAALALGAPVVAPVAAVPTTAEPLTRRLTGQANIVLVVVDDMRQDDLSAMPYVSAALGGGGVSFDNAYAVNPLCCPSRANILTGQYAHNTGVMDNKGRNGGFDAFRDTDTIATWLDASGYTTGYVGKYLNGYAKQAPEYVPPGWDTWRATTKRTYQYEGRTTYNFNGRLVDRKGYQTDVMTRLATRFVERSAGSPFLLHLSYVAPHAGTEADGSWDPPIPAERHAHAYDGIAPPDGPAVNEADVSDKPAALQGELLDDDRLARIAELNELRRESLLAVDEGVAALIETLRAQGVLDETYVVFTSDNGFFLGEHRFAGGKRLHHERSSKVPLLVTGPGVPAAASRRQVVGLHDLAPTFLRMGRAWGAQGDFAIDGRSLLPLIDDPEQPTGRDLLIEGVDPGSAWLEYDAIRTDGWKYVEYVNGETELYDLAADPHELDNLVGEPFASSRRAWLASALRELRYCSGRDCRTTSTG